MKELGAYLKSQREEKKVTLEEVSVATKISVKVLQAIEEGDIDHLPPKPFVRGFIQAYARYLNLNVQEVLDRYQKAIGAQPPPASLPIAETTKKIEKPVTGGARNIMTVTAIVILIVVIVIVQKTISKREAEMRGEVSAITGNAEPLNLKPSPSPGASPGASGAEIAMGALASPVEYSKTTPTPTPETKPTPTPKVKEKEKPTPTPTPTPETKPSPTATPEEKPTATPTPEPTATPVPVPQEIIVEALDKVTIKVTVDNGAEKEVTMNPDQIQTFKAKGKVKIYTPDGGAISIIQNGFDLGVPGNLGQPKTMVFPK